MTLLFCPLVSDGLFDTTFCQGDHEIAGKLIGKVLFVYLFNLFTDTGIFDWDQESYIHLSLCSFTDQEWSIEDYWFQLFHITVRMLLSYKVINVSA